MKIFTILILSLTALALLPPLQPHSIVVSAIESSYQTEVRPSVYKVRLKGKKLIVIGDNFEQGAVILLEDTRVKTKPDPNYPGTRLIAKKAGKLIEPNEFFDVAVENPGQLEGEFITYFKGESFTARVLPSGNHARGVLVDLGDYTMTAVPLDNAQRVQIDPDFLLRVLNENLPSSGFRLYQTIKRGDTFFHAEGPARGELGPEIIYSLPIRIE